MKVLTVASNHYGCEPLKTVVVGKGEPRKVWKNQPQLYSIMRIWEEWISWTSFYQFIDRESGLRMVLWPIFAWTLAVSLPSSWKLWVCHATAADTKARRKGFLHFLRTNWAIRESVPHQEHRHAERVPIAVEQPVNRRFDKIDHVIFETSKSRECKLCYESLLAVKRA